MSSRALLLIVALLASAVALLYSQPSPLELAAPRVILPQPATKVTTTAAQVPAEPLVKAKQPLKSQQASQPKPTPIVVKPSKPRTAKPKPAKTSPMKTTPAAAPAKKSALQSTSQPAQAPARVLPPPSACPVRRRYPLAVSSPLSRFEGSGSQLLVGVEPEHGPYQMWRVSWFECVVNHPVDIVQYAEPFDEPFHQYLADRVWQAGAIPLLTWEPWSYKAGVAGYSGAVVDQPRYSLKTIIDGRHDAYIRSFAHAVRRFGRPLLLRFAPEMNGSWNSWSESRNGNHPGDFIRAWRHVHQIFKEQGAQNVVWVWSPDADCGSCSSLARYYPGSTYVDVLAADGYNWGHLHPWNAWRSFAAIFASPFAVMSRLGPGKPLLVAETASAEAGGSKARWISDFIAGLSHYPSVAGFVWFNQAKETDWRVQSSETARSAFVLGLRRAPESAAAGRLRQRLAAIEARYRRALEAGQLFP